MAFLAVNKYPPSLAYMLLFSGVNLMVISAFSRAGHFWARKDDPLQVFGKCPFFFYILHLFFFLGGPETIPGPSRLLERVHLLGGRAYCPLLAMPFLVGHLPQLCSICCIIMRQNTGDHERGKYLMLGTFKVDVLTIRKGAPGLRERGGCSCEQEKDQDTC